MKPSTAPLLLALALAALGTGCASPGATFLTTKTPYQPPAAASYQAVPAGYLPVHTQMLARHGTRGLTSMKSDLALLNLWRLAAADNALTPLGRALGPDLERLIRANALLGDGIDGISRPGYGNLSLTGIEEHRQLARRVLQRLPGLFATAATGQQRIAIQSSGVDRARDSAWFFVQSMSAAMPALAPVLEPATVNRFELYFHKLDADKDLAADGAPLSPLYQATYAQSQAYQAYRDSAALASRLAAIHDDPRIKAAAREVLGRLFSATFLARLERGLLSAANTGEVSVTSDDGKFTRQLSGDGDSRIGGLVDALLALSSVVDIAPGLRSELGKDFTDYLPAQQAGLLAWANDSENFYSKGPGVAEDNPVTYQMAGALLADFFGEIDAVADGSSRHAAKFRFAHAETIIPFASRLQLPGIFAPLPAAQDYQYANNPWRGERVAPYAANIQWDTFRNRDGALLVRMLYNEKEMDFKAGCDGARLAAGSHFYVYGKLKACYGQ